MSFYSNVFKSATKTAKKASSQIADLGTNIFTKRIKSSSNVVKKRITKSISNKPLLKSVAPSTKTNAVSKAANSILPSNAGVKGVGSSLAVTKKRLLQGAGIGGLVGLSGLGLGLGIKGVKDQLDPVRRKNKNEEDANENYSDYLDNVQREQDIINAGKESGSIDPNYFSGSDGGLLSGDPSTDSSGGGNKTMVLLGLGAAAVGAYFLFKKKKGKGKK